MIDPHRTRSQVKHRVGHPVERRRVQRQALGLSDLLGADAPFDRDRLRRERVGLDHADQRLRKPQGVPVATARGKRVG